MTETYHGPWSPIRGDIREETVQDTYHPRYPDAGFYQKTEGLIEKPTVNVDRLVAAGVAGSGMIG